MKQSSTTDPTLDKEIDAAPTAMQQAIRRRALDTIAEQHARPPTPLSRRLLVIGMTLVAMLVFVLLVNFVVTGMYKIMDVWYPGSISSRVKQSPTAQPALGVDQPFYITVDPPLNEARSTEISASSNTSLPSR